MMLRKGKIEGRLKIPLESAVRLIIKSGSMQWQAQQIKFPDIYDIIRRDPMKTGIPEYYAVRHDRYVVYPIPDRRYYCRLVGTVLQEQ